MQGVRRVRRRTGYLHSRTGLGLVCTVGGRRKTSIACRALAGAGCRRRKGTRLGASATMRRARCTRRWRRGRGRRRGRCRGRSAVAGESQRTAWRRRKQEAHLEVEEDDGGGNGEKDGEARREAFEEVVRVLHDESCTRREGKRVSLVGDQEERIATHRSAARP